MRRRNRNLLVKDIINKVFRRHSPHNRFATLDHNFGPLFRQFSHRIIDRHHLFFLNRQIFIAKLLEQFDLFLSHLAWIVELLENIEYPKYPIIKNLPIIVLNVLIIKDFLPIVIFTPVFVI